MALLATGDIGKAKALLPRARIAAEEADEPGALLPVLLATAQLCVATDDLVKGTADRDDVDGARIVTHCERALADYKVPRYVVLRTDPLPRLPSGKIARRAVREEYHDVAERFTRSR